MKVELDLSNYATKSDLKNATDVDTSKFAKKVDLANLKSNVDKLDIDKLVPVPVDLSKLSDEVKNDVVKKDVYNAKIKITNLATNNTLNAKINDVKGEIPSITNLATTSVFTAVENKIPNVSNLVKKTDYNTKINEIENKITSDSDNDEYITTQEFNELTFKNFTARLKQVNLGSKVDIANVVKKKDFDIKLKNVTSNKIN